VVKRNDCYFPHSDINDMLILMCILKILKFTLGTIFKIRRSTEILPYYNVNIYLLPNIKLN
jgi:hypothetical protein